VAGVEADRFFPSSKTGSECGAVKATLTLAERSCALRALPDKTILSDRLGDTTARTSNTKRMGSTVAASGAETIPPSAGEHGRGADELRLIEPAAPRPSRAQKRQAGTASAGRSSTVTEETGNGLLVAA
jgi:hypothetical protein